MGTLRDLNQQHGDSRTLGTWRAGFLPSELPDTGPDGDNILLNDSLDPAKEYMPVRQSGPATGTLFLYEDGSLSFAPAGDGEESFTYKLREDGILLSAVATVTLTSGEAEPPAYVLTPSAVAVQIQLGSLSWAYTAPAPDSYQFTPETVPVDVVLGAISWAYTPPESPEYTLTPDSLGIQVALGSISWAYTPPDPDGDALDALATLEEADEYILDYHGSDSAWFGLTTTKKKILLRQATQYLLGAYKIQEEYLDPVHQNVKAACAEAALKAMSGDLFADAPTQYVESVSIGPISRKLSAPRNSGQTRFAVIDALLKGLTYGSYGQVMLVRA